MATVIKRDLVVEVTNICGLTHQQASDALDALVDVITRKLQNGEAVALRRFGVFTVKVAKAKKGRNPKTPDVEILIPERCALRFKPSLELKQNIRDLNPSKVADRRKNKKQLSPAE